MPVGAAVASARRWPRLGRPAVIERYYRELLNFLCHAVRDRDRAADLAQESFARVLAAQRAGRAAHNPRALLYRTARNLVIDQHRHAQVRRQAGETAACGGDHALHAVAAPAAHGPEAILASRQGLAAILATIEQLPPRCREAFILHKFDGLSCAQVAERMGISPRTVEMQLQIAMRACWRRMDELEGTPPDSADDVPGDRRQTPP